MNLDSTSFCNSGTTVFEKSESGLGFDCVPMLLFFLEVRNTHEGGW